MGDRRRHSWRCPLLQHVQILPAVQGEPHTERLGKCSKMECMMTQRYDLCPQHTTAKLMLVYEKDGEQRTVFAFAYGETVHQIAGVDDISVEVLTEAGTFKSMTLLKDRKEVNK